MNAPHKTSVVSLLGALGIVYGDIGTSPLYALRECFHAAHGILLNINNILGLLSLIFWSLTLIISIKYISFIMRVDNNGEGGILALTALALRRATSKKQRKLLMWIGMMGAALFYGDGMITPAISVLSAVEGLEIVNPVFATYTIPITLSILLILFMMQQRGTATVGALFGPIMLTWFLTLAMTGIYAIVQHPIVLAAINPIYAVYFFVENRWLAFMAVGSVFLVVTGGEALYADMGHFGTQPIRIAWFFIVFPALILNYFGQGSLLIANPAAIENPFFLLVPQYFTIPMVILATLATVIASQAVISGVFSLTRQAVQLDYCPRLTIDHTSEETVGQIYVPWINWMLLAMIVALVLIFHSSSNLAAAYGIAVTGTMVITSYLAFVALYAFWGWGIWLGSAVAAVFLTLDLGFLAANLLKLFQGGWLPLLIGMGIFVLMYSWKRGRENLAIRMRHESFPLDLFLASLTHTTADSPVRVHGTAIFMTSNTEETPTALLHNLKHNKVLHDRIVFMTILTQDIPYVKPNERLCVETLGTEIYRMVAHYGFWETPDVPEILKLARPFKLEFDMMETTFFLSRETLTLRAKQARHQSLWKDILFINMLRNARSATDFFRIPGNRVVELGRQIDL
jgi:KUP system potassium uptake protein